MLSFCWPNISSFFHVASLIWLSDTFFLDDVTENAEMKFSQINELHLSI